MNINAAILYGEFQRAIRAWPFIPAVERQYGLASMTLFAVGSRETNLTNEIGDGGHGHGVWQLDDRSHTIPPDFMHDVRQQCVTAASMLANLLSQFGGRYDCAFAAYNAGAGTVRYNLDNRLDVDTGTAGGDYSADVTQRMHYLQGREGTSMARTLTNDDLAALANAVWAFRYKAANGETEKMADWVTWADIHSSESAQGVSLIKRKIGA